MSSPIRIALVGRPNVGKSALFNAICKKRVAIVDEQEGITRDRLYQTSDLFGTPFEIIDTGGINTVDPAQFQEEIIQQAEIAILEADSIILVVDATVGLTDLDLDVAKRLHRTKKPICVAVNKVDNHSLQNTQFDFLPLGIPTITCVSAQHNYQIAELIEKAIEPVPKKEINDTAEHPNMPCVAIVGRTNVGKSTLLNALTGEQRSIVSPIAATTRDSIDSVITRNDKEYLLIDTAGLRKKRKEKEVVEKFAHIRTKEAIDRTQVCLLVIDAEEGMTSEEKKIAAMIAKEKKCCILLINKWDLTKGFRMEHCFKGLEEEISFIAKCPKVIISAKTGRNLDKIFGLVDTQLERYSARIGTGQLNKFLIAAMQNYHPPAIGGKRLRIYYMTQVAKSPPEFVLFINHPKLLAPSYKRYLINTIKDTFDLHGVPLTFTLRKKEPPKRKGRTPTSTSSFDRDMPTMLDTYS